MTKPCVGLDLGTKTMGLALAAPVVRLLGVDVGSRWCAASAIEPGLALASGTLDINPDNATKPSRLDVGPAVAWLIGCAIMSGADRFVVEHSEDWAPWPGMKPAAAKVTAANWALCDRIVQALQRDSPIPVEIIHARSWRSKLFRALPPEERELDERTDAKVRRALALTLPAASFAILSALCPPCTSPVHQYDAAGAAVGALKRTAEAQAEPKPPRLVRPPGALPPRRRATRNAAWLARRAATLLAARASAGCHCGNQHRKGCPLYTRKADYRVTAMAPRACGCGPRGPHRQGCQG